MAFRRLKRKKGEEELELVEEEILIEEADDEYVLLKAFMSKNPEVAFSYAINRIDELKVEVSSLSKEKDSLDRLNTTLQDDIEDAFRFPAGVEAKQLFGKLVFFILHGNRSDRSDCFQLVLIQGGRGTEIRRQHRSQHFFHFRLVAPLVRQEGA